MNTTIKIHIKSKNGIYIVAKYDYKNLYLTTVSGAKNFIVPRKDFKCLAGGRHNFRLNIDIKNTFLKEMNKPEYIPKYRKDFAQTDDYVGYKEVYSKEGKWINQFEN